MPEVAMLNSDGAEVGNVTLSPDVFGVNPNTHVVHREVVEHLARMRQGTVDTKTRGEVSGGGKKPYRQKGTGRARQGSIRAPHWPGGGVVWGPHQREYDVEMPKKMRRLAMKSALSAKLAEGQITVVDELKMEAISTKKLIEQIGKLGVQGKTLLVIGESNETLRKSAQNVPWLQLRVAPYISTYELLDATNVVFTKAALDVVEAQGK